MHKRTIALNPNISSVLPPRDPEKGEKHRRAPQRPNPDIRFCFLVHRTVPKALLFWLLYYLSRTASIPPRRVFILVLFRGAQVPALHTWAAVRGQIAVAVAVAGGAAVDAAVVVVGAGVGPCVGQPGLSGRLPDVQQTGSVETKSTLRG